VEATVGGCARGQRGEGLGGSHARGGGDELFARGADEEKSSARVELVGGGWFYFFFYMMWVQSLASG